MKAIDFFGYTAREFSNCRLFLAIFCQQIIEFLLLLKNSQKITLFWQYFVNPKALSLKFVIGKNKLKKIFLIT